MINARSGKNGAGEGSGPLGAELAAGKQRLVAVARTGRPGALPRGATAAWPAADELAESRET